MFSSLPSFGNAMGNMGMGLISDMANSALNYYAQRDLMHEAQDWQRYVMQNQKQWQVEDLKKAGLNPVLATGLGASAPSSPTATFTGATSQGMREALASVRKRESKIADEQINKLKAETKTAEAVARSASAQAVRDELLTKRDSHFWNSKSGSESDLLHLTSMMGSTAQQGMGHFVNLFSAGRNAFGGMHPVLEGIRNLWQEAKKRYKDTSAKDVPKAPEGHIILDGKPVKLRFKRDARDQM